MSDTILSGRQEEVLNLLSDGHSPRGVATELGIRLSTVYSHIDRIGTKRAKAERTLEILDEAEIDY
ncbi:MULTISPECIES: LuxR C-terminal-related transcriptional regulator [Haloferax]|uniref:HTH luxR-type domain-containing protein n=1 Tax=Haloferax marinum TaxID=2666143 RepID=A0A6A8G8A3_9EURY|nr:hypothetical protein Hfx1150_09465 [Haloferax sp. CBA1150]MRW96792.1 hypothetical protein [Haloferax marinum]